MGIQRPPRGHLVADLSPLQPAWVSRAQTPAHLTAGDTSLGHIASRGPHSCPQRLCPPAQTLVWPPSAGRALPPVTRWACLVPAVSPGGPGPSSAGPREGSGRPRLQAFFRADLCPQHCPSSSDHTAWHQRHLLRRLVPAPVWVSRSLCVLRVHSRKPRTASGPRLLMALPCPPAARDWGLAWMHAILGVGHWPGAGRTLPPLPAAEHSRTQ